MNITIVGGGTAGWIAAYFILHSQPNCHKITVIESSKIGIIGAGEGSTGIFVDLLNGHFFNSKIKIDDFLKNTDATKKYGIKHKNWSVNNNEYFAPLDSSPTGFSLDDYFLKYIIYSKNNKKTHLASKIGIEYENKIFNNTYALHFDGYKVGKFFKEVCLKNNVKHIDSEVKDCILKNNGEVEKIILENNLFVYSDLFIDCTGFSKKIISCVGSKWIDKSDILPLNTAMPFTIKYKEDEKVDPVTIATALSSGWMWEIPLQTRKGMGYVFDENFLSVDDAKLEIEKKIKTEIFPIKIIKFKSGFLDKTWNKNVISFGLSSSFVEPLEATSINNTIAQIAIFVKEFLKKDKKASINLENENRYNKKIYKLNSLTIDFISLHYQGGKEDSEFWKYIKNEKIISSGAQEYLEISKNIIPSVLSINGMFGSYSAPLANWIGSGIGILDKNVAKESLVSSNLLEYSEIEYKKFYKNIVNEKKYIYYS